MKIHIRQTIDLPEDVAELFSLLSPKMRSHLLSTLLQRFFTTLPAPERQTLRQATLTRDFPTFARIVAPNATPNAPPNATPIAQQNATQTTLQAIHDLIT